MLLNIIGYLLRNWVWVLGIILGIPTSYYGYVWVQTKLIDQQLNCLKIGYSIDADKPDLINGKIKDFQKCLEEIDPRIGTKEFLENKIK